MEIDDSPIPVEGGLTLVASTLDEDWYMIEKATHEHTHGLAPIPGTPGSMMLVHSGRVSDADVEGTTEQMLKIADAIEHRREFFAGRCAVDARKKLGKRVEFWSPRNSIRTGSVTLEVADKLAALIREKFT